MKIHNFLILTFAGFLTSCGGGQLNPQYIYNTNPNYTWGYADFYGAYYANYNNTNNVISLSLFSDSLKINGIGNLTGLGQFLFLEDVFVAPTDTLLADGTYTVNDTGLPFTVAPGKNDTVDNQVYPIGAEISYYEENSAKSTLKLISGGSFTVSRLGSIYSISCNFKTTDSTQIKGSFKANLPFRNQSLASPNLENRKRLQFVL